MPIYEYACPTGPHVFEKILPMSESDKNQECPEHHTDCERTLSMPAPWVWGYNEVHWTAGMKQNPSGMNHAKTHQTLHKEKK